MSYYVSDTYCINMATISVGGTSNTAVILLESSVTATVAVAVALAGYIYLGCYTEVASARTLTRSHSTSETNTVLSCSRSCSVLITGILAWNLAIGASVGIPSRRVRCFQTALAAWLARGTGRKFAVEVRSSVFIKWEYRQAGPTGV